MAHTSLSAWLAIDSQLIHGVKLGGKPTVITQPPSVGRETTARTAYKKVFDSFPARDGGYWGALAWRNNEGDVGGCFLVVEWEV